MDTSEAKERFDRITSENIGKKMAFILDGRTIIRPIIKDRIPNGFIEIGPGGPEIFSLANALKATIFPTPYEIQLRRAK